MIGVHKTEIRSCVIVVSNGFDRVFENFDCFQVFLFAYSKVLEHINKGNGIKRSVFLLSKHMLPQIRRKFFILILLLSLKFTYYMFLNISIFFERYVKLILHFRRFKSNIRWASSLFIFCKSITNILLSCHHSKIISVSDFSIPQRPNTEYCCNRCWKVQRKDKSRLNI